MQAAYCPNISVYPQEAAILTLAPTRRRLRARQVTLEDGTILSAQARVPTKRDECVPVEQDDSTYVIDTSNPALPAIPSDNFDPSI